MLEQSQRTYPVVIELPIQWGEMVAFNHVNNVTYFRCFESARIAYFERTPIMEMERMKTEGAGLVRRHL